MTRHILSGLKKAAHVRCDSAATRDEILEHSLIPAERLTVVHNGVHPALRPETRARADAELSRMLGRNPGALPELIHVGSTIPRKRIDVLLRVFAEVVRHQSNVRLLRVGGQLTSEQQDLAASLRIADRVDSLPRLTPELLAAAYRRSNVLLQPSESEGFGLPVIEAMACGTPVIASDIPSLREIGGEVATFCCLEDIPAWTRVVLAQVKSGTDRHRLAHHAQRFSWSHYAASMVEIYRQVLAR
jgi:glycosyltransferase involved in cell wall biosynthesis